MQGWAGIGRGQPAILEWAEGGRESVRWGGGGWEREM